jgi:5-methylcytosine-specific restriction endonuclease McrA
MPYQDQSDYNAYMKKYMKNRWNNRRKEAIEKLGGKCTKCGSTENLEFDHKKRAGKKFTLADFSSKNEKEFQAELKKCRLLCRPCHYERTGKQFRKAAARIAGVDLKTVSGVK